MFFLKIETASIFLIFKMNRWFEFDELVAECVYRYGYFSIYTLTRSEHEEYYTYYLAHQWIKLHPGEGLDRPIQRSFSELMSKEMVDIIHMRSITPEVWEIMENYSLNVLKKLVSRHYCTVARISIGEGSQRLSQSAKHLR